MHLLVFWFSVYLLFLLLEGGGNSPAFDGFLLGLLLYREDGGVMLLRSTRRYNSEVRANPLTDVRASTFLASSLIRCACYFLFQLNIYTRENTKTNKWLCNIFKLITQNTPAQFINIYWIFAKMNHYSSKVKLSL
jgi:hypothetical protein